MEEADIWATAAAFIRDFGSLAVNEALNAAEVTYEAGERNESEDWLKIAAAIEELELDKIMSSEPPMEDLGPKA